MMTISKQALIKLLGDRPIAYHPMLARALGGVIEAVFVSQLLYWYDRGQLEDNWIWKTQAEWTDETGLTRSNQETARRNLKKMGLLKEKRKGVPGKIHFQLDLDRLADLLTMLDFNIVETPQCAMPEPDIVQCEDPANNNAKTPQCITESTTETIIDDNREGASPARDYLTDVLEHSQKPDRAGIADPSQDIAAYMQTTNAFMDVYHKLTKLWPDTEVQKVDIFAIAALPDADIDLWEKVIRAWLGLGWSKRNVTGMIDYYMRSEIPSTGKNGGKHAPNNRTGRVPNGVPKYSVADPAAFDQQLQDDDGHGSS